MKLWVIYIGMLFFYVWNEGNFYLIMYNLVLVVYSSYVEVLLVYNFKVC